MNSPGFIAGSFATRFISDRFGRKATILGSAFPMALGTVSNYFIKAVLRWSRALADPEGAV